MNKPTLDKSKVIFVLLFAVVVGVMYLIQFGCVYQRVFGITCPGCGMTRAVLSLFKLDFKAALNYHGMVWSLPILGLYFLCDGRPFKNKYINRAIIVAIGIGFFINWLSHPILV